MPVTMISSAPCHLEMVPPVASLRVMSHEPTVIATIMTQVVTIVSLIFMKP